MKWVIIQFLKIYKSLERYTGTAQPQPLPETHLELNEDSEEIC